MKFHDNQARTKKKKTLKRDVKTWSWLRKMAPGLQKERTISSAIVFISNVTMSKTLLYYIYINITKIS